MSSSIKSSNNNKKRKRESFSSRVASVLKNGKLVNFYGLIKENKEDEKAKLYSTHKDIRIDFPFQQVIAGATGAGKTNFVMNLIAGIGEIKHIFLVTKKPSEPLYKLLTDKYKKIEEKVGEKLIHIITDPKNEMPTMDELDDIIGNSKALLIIDDFVNEPIRNLQEILNSVVTGRKAGKGGLATVYLTQKFYSTPKLIRDNSSIISLGKILSNNDLHRITSEFSLELQPEDLADLHARIQKQNRLNFLTIDLTKSKLEDIEFKYRKNLAPIKKHQLLSFSSEADQ